MPRSISEKMWSIHNWIGLYAGVVIAVLSITGVVALFKVEIDEAFNSRLFKVTPEDNYVQITPIIDSLKQVYGAKNLTSISVPKTSEGSWNTSFFVRKSITDFHHWQIFINPYTGKILGTRDINQSLAFFIRSIHVRLYESIFGRQIVGLAGLALLFSTISGFWIYGRYMKTQFFGVIRTKNLRIEMADYHKLIGVATLVFNIIIAITGAWLGLQSYLQPLLMDSRPGTFKVAEKPLSKEEDIRYNVNYQEILAKTKEHFPELIPYSISPSLDGSRTITIRGAVPRTAYERHSFKITFDKKDLKELHRFDIREASMGAKLFYIQESLHFGDFGGFIMKILYSFFGITSGFLSLSGFIIYLKRTERKRSEKPDFVELKPLLLRWTYGILSVTVILGILHVIFGVLVPTMIVTLTLYGSLLFLLIRAIILWIKRKFFYKSLPKHSATRVNS